MNDIHINQSYDTIWAALIRAPKDGSYIPIEDSDKVDKHIRLKLSRAMRARAERQNLPYILHAVRTKKLQFWWEEKHVRDGGNPLSCVLKKIHEMDKERFDLAVDAGLHPALESNKKGESNEIGYVCNVVYSRN